MITFRQIRKKDFKHVHDLALDGWYFAYSHLPKKELKKLVDNYYSTKNLKLSLDSVKKGTGFFALAFDGKKLIGFCHVGLWKRSWELFKLYIDPNLIGKGLGKKLLSVGENFLKSKGCKKYFTFANKHNKIGLDFYMRNGFKRIKEKDEDDEFEKKALRYIEKTF